jgi:hypothetical protein
MLNAGGFGTRYRTWGTSGSPIVLVPGAFETADTFAALGAALMISSPRQVTAAIRALIRSISHP